MREGGHWEGVGGCGVALQIEGGVRVFGIQTKKTLDLVPVFEDLHRISSTEDPRGIACAICASCCAGLLARPLVICGVKKG